MRLREGVKDVVYRDSLGKPTVGIGHLVLPSDKLKVGDRISDARISAFFALDSGEALDAAHDQADEAGITSDAFLPYLASVNYQLGTGWRGKFPTTWRLIVAGSYAKAADGLDATLWAKQTPVRVRDFQGALRALPPKKL